SGRSAGKPPGWIAPYATDRPQSNIAVDANSFRGRHELKFGFGWRKASVTSTDAFPGNGVVSYHNGDPVMLARVTRPVKFVASASYQSAYAGDACTMHGITLNAGLRWHRQASSLGAASVPGSTVLPNLLPPISATPAKDVVVWNAVSPRVGVTYALDVPRTTIARASYAMFASQLNAAQAVTASAIQYSGIYYYAIDQNANRIADPAE